MRRKAGDYNFSQKARVYSVKSFQGISFPLAYPERSERPPGEHKRHFSYTLSLFEGRVLRIAVLIEDSRLKMAEQDVFENARNEIRRAIRADRTGKEYLIPMTKQDNQSRVVLSKIFFEFAYQDKKDPDKREPAKVTYLYQGRERSTPVPLCVLQKRPTPSDLRQTPLRVGLISMRHPRMDHVVDMYWFVNKDIMALENSNFRERDDYCYQVSQVQLEELVMKHGIRRFHLYMTGYPAAVIGFYRALIAYLYEQQKPGSSYPSIEVTPYYFNNNQEFYRKGDSWN